MLACSEARRETGCGGHRQQGTPRPQLLVWAHLQGGTPSTHQVLKETQIPGRFGVLLA